MVLSMAAYIVNDTLVKVVSESLPSGQLIFVRGVFASVAVLLWMRLTGTTLRWRELAHPLVALRARKPILRARFLRCGRKVGCMVGS